MVVQTCQVQIAALLDLAVGYKAKFAGTAFLVLSTAHPLEGGRGAGKGRRHGLCYKGVPGGQKPDDPGY